MEPVSLLVGAGIAATGYLIGRVGRWRSGRSRRGGATALESGGPRPVCGCEHGLAFHDRQTGACHATVQRPTKFDKVYGPVAFEAVPCTCRHYVGPVPLDEVFAPQITE